MKKQLTKSWHHQILKKLKHWPIYNSKGEIFKYTNLVQDSMRGYEYNLSHKQFSEEVKEEIKNAYLTAAQLSSKAYKYINRASKEHLDVLRSYSGYDEYAATKYLKGVFVPVLYGEECKIEVTRNNNVKITNEYYQRILIEFDAQNIIDDEFVEVLEDSLDRDLRDYLFSIQVGAHETVNIAQFVRFPRIIEVLQEMVNRYNSVKKDTDFIKGIVAYKFKDDKEPVITEHNEIRYDVVKERQLAKFKRDRERKRALNAHIEKYGEFSKEEIAAFNGAWYGEQPRKRNRNKEGKRRGK